MNLTSIITEILRGVDKAAIGILIKALFEKEIITIGDFTKKKGANLLNAVTRLLEKPKLKDIQPEELIDKIDDIEQETLQPILEGVLLGHKDEIIRQKWINLLESAILGYQIHPRYIKILGVLNGVDANVLEFIADYRKRGNRLTDFEIITALQQRKIENVTEEMVKESLDNLTQLGLCDVNTLQGKARYSDMDSQNIFISHFGGKFLHLVGEKSSD